MADTTAPRGTFLQNVFLAPVNNPYGLGNVDYLASPTFIDIDDDGDLDAFIGNTYGNLVVYLNTGTASNPVFGTAATNPYGLSSVVSAASPSFVDIDADGDLDAFIGNYEGNTLMFRNTGTSSSPAFAAATVNPYGLGDVGLSARPSFVDIDADGDLDAFIGNSAGQTRFYQNTGTAASPAFGAAITEPFGLGDVGFSASPSFADIDGDGDWDIFFGTRDTDTRFYLNVGSASSPAFGAATVNPYGLTNAGMYTSLSLVDIDADGDLDAFIGNLYGNTLVFINEVSPVAPVTTTTANGTYGTGDVITLKVAFDEKVIVNTSGGKPTLALETGTIDRFAIYTSGSGTSTLTFTYTVQAGDSSADLDVISQSALALNGGTIKDAAGNNAVLTLAAPGTAGSLGANSHIVVLLDTTAPHGSLPSTPVFASPIANPYGFYVGNFAGPSFVDLDGDGDLDAVLTNFNGKTLVYQNTGSARNPVFASATVNPFDLASADVFAEASFGDIDADGDLDALIGNRYGETLVYLNTGTAQKPAFAAALTNPYGLGDVGNYASPSFVDIDGDGDLDAFIGNGLGNTLVYLNTGTVSRPAFAAAVSNPYGLGDVGDSASPSFVDIDGDGDLDALIGNRDGNTLVQLNTGTVRNPAFAAASINPYGLSDVGASSTPSFVDIDGDGDLDAFVSSSTGNTLLFINTASPVAPVTSTTANGTYRAGSVITITVSFNENVIVNTSGGRPTLALETGTTDRFATYVSGSGTNTLTFRYTVKAGDSSADLDFTSTSALSLNGGTIQDAAGNNAILTLAAPGATGSLAASKALVIDGINDILNGTAGADTLNGGVGADTMTGGQGADFYYVDNAGDKVVETDASALGGIDTVYSYLAAYTLTSNVERGVIKTSAAANLTGNALANKLYGGAGDNTLSALAGNDYLKGGAGQDKLVGGLGADTMVGGDGNDYYYVDDAGDKVVETEAQAAVGGVDTVYSTLAGYTLTSNVERGLIQTSGVANLTGNALANNLYGGIGNNKLTGAAGNDYLSGDAGDDVLLGDAGNDRLVGGTGADRLTGGLDADTFVIDSAGGRDVITDFSSTQGDKISLRSNLNGSGITSGATALAHVHDSGANAVLELGGGNIVILLGVQTAELNASDFIVL